MLVQRRKRWTNVKVKPTLIVRHFNEHLFYIRYSHLKRYLEVVSRYREPPLPSTVLVNAVFYVGLIVTVASLL